MKAASPKSRQDPLKAEASNGQPPSEATLNSVQGKPNVKLTLPATGKVEPLFALRPVRLTLELIDATHGGATAIAHSALDQQDGTRLIRVGLCSTHILVNRALRRADTVTIKFLIGLSLVEYTLYWFRASDGKGVNDALREAAGYALDENVWGSGFASRLAISSLLRSIDALPIFGASPKAGPHIIGELRTVLRHPSDIPRWRFGAPDGQPVSKKAKARPMPHAEKAEKAPSFSEVFLECSREVLDTATIATLTDLTKERLTQ
jgi:hypothetical protein